MALLDGETLDIKEENIEKMKQFFPEAFEEGKIDFDKLRQLLGDYVDDSTERYNFTWNGKGQALRLSQTPSMGTLRPCKEESKDWDTTQNLYIEGDNLEVLKLLQKSYYGKVKIIYIDPPYNTGHEFVYDDDFSDNIKHYKKITNQIDDEGNKITENTESNGKFHTNWLNMMYSRLRLARNLLASDGLIFISIGDEESCNLKKICDEIFGEINFRNQILVRRGSKSIQAQFDTWDKLGQGAEYIMLYSKNSEYRFPKQERKLDEMKPGSWNNHWRGTDRPTMRYPLFGITPPNGQWRWGKERSEQAQENYKQMLLDLGKNEDSITNEEIDQWYLKQKNRVDLLRLSNNSKPEHYIPPTDTTLLNTLWTDLLVGSSSEIISLFNSKIFDTAKLTTTLMRIIKFTSNDAIILDFFAGSSSTAEAVMHLNAIDNGNRTFIMVQIPESTKNESEAFLYGYKNICEIGKERIRRAGEQIKAECPQEDLDVGFKDFKLDTSNIKKWQADGDTLEADLGFAVDNVVKGRSELDVVYEIILKMGLSLTYPVVERDMKGKKIYVIGDGALMICLDLNITLDVAEGMVALQKEYQPEVWKVVFYDNGFVDDQTKTNSKEILKNAGLDEDAFTTI